MPDLHISLPHTYRLRILLWSFTAACLIPLYCSALPWFWVLPLMFSAVGYAVIYDRRWRKQERWDWLHIRSHSHDRRHRLSLQNQQESQTRLTILAARVLLAQIAILETRDQHNQVVLISIDLKSLPVDDARRLRAWITLNG